jgi:hypothetical protein
MSFKATYSDVILCNRALSHLPEAPIAQMDAPGVAARECRAWYIPVVRRVLTMHDWGIATKIESLAVSSTNLRDNWAFAYAEPSDLAYAIDVLPPLDAASYGSGVYRPSMLASTSISRFSKTDGKIYSNIEDARLVYTSLDITEDVFTEDFVEVVEYYLAAKLAMPITKRGDLAKSLEDEGDAKVNKAIALYRGQQNQRYGDELTETEWVRRGLPIGYSDQGQY